MSNPIEINQANSQHSTGPKTEAGKQRSCLNALRHATNGQIIVMPTENLEIYESHKKSFIDEYDPQGATEAHLVQSLADVSWRLNRIAALETNLLTLTFAPVALIEGVTVQSKALCNLSMHSQRLSRQFERTVVQLRELQNARRSQEKQDLDVLLDLTKIYEDKGETYNPSADGFVFSQTQIASAIRARNRERLLEQACDAAA